MATTLVLTRNPLKAFMRENQSGRFGELIVIKGPQVKMAKVVSGSPTPQREKVTQEVTNGFVKSVDGLLGALHAGVQYVPINTGTLELRTEGGAINEVKRFTTVERFKADRGGSGYYIQLRPKPNPYFVTFEASNSVVKTLRSGHDGRCFRVHGGKGKELGILIHEAPHVGWVIGCIGPRPLNDYRTGGSNVVGNPSYRAMEELFRLVGRERTPFFVLDW